MSAAYVKDAQVRVTHGRFQGVIGVIEALEGPLLRIKVRVIPPHLERCPISECITVRATDARVH